MKDSLLLVGFIPLVGPGTNPDAPLIGDAVLN